MLTIPDGTDTSPPQSKCDRQFEPHSWVPSLLPSPWPGCVAQPGQLQSSPHVHAPSTTSSCVGKDSGSSPSTSIPSSIGSTLTPAFLAISSKLDIPGRPTAERLISVAVLPSELSAAERNLLISASGRNRRLFPDAPDILRLEDADPRRRWPGSPLEYGEYSLVLCTCRLVCAG